MYILKKPTIFLAGPMPFIKGITDSISDRPAINPQIPPINTLDVERFQVAFNGANPILGILDSALFIFTVVPLA